MPTARCSRCSGRRQTASAPISLVEVDGTLGPPCGVRVGCRLGRKRRTLHRDRIPYGRVEAGVGFPESRIGPHAGGVGWVAITAIAFDPSPQPSPPEETMEIFTWSLTDWRRTAVRNLGRAHRGARLHSRWASHCRRVELRRDRAPEMAEDGRGRSARRCSRCGCDGPERG